MICSKMISWCMLVLSSLSQIPCSKPDTFIFVQNGRCNFLGKNMSLCLFKVLFSLFTAKLPLNHHLGNMCVFFPSTEEANLSDGTVDVLGLERDGTNGLDQKFGLQNYWIFHLGWCLLIFLSDSSGWSPSLVREFGIPSKKPRLIAGFCKTSNLGTNLGSFWCSRWWLHICFVVLTAISCGNDRI